MAGDANDNKRILKDLNRFVRFDFPFGRRAKPSRRRRLREEGSAPDGAALGPLGTLATEGTQEFLQIFQILQILLSVIQRNSLIVQSRIKVASNKH